MRKGGPWSRDEFTAHVRENEELRGRFIADPEAVLREFHVDMELTDDELDGVVGGTSSQSAFVHSLLTMIFEKEGPDSDGE